MKKVGIIGGMGPESTVDYYQLIISKFQEKVGSRETLPELYINSINMYKMFELIKDEKTEQLVNYLAKAAQKLEYMGADFIVMAANTPHIVFGQVKQQINIPMISIVEETYSESHKFNLKKVGLIGTQFTMEHDFFKKPFLKHNLDIAVPTHNEQAYIHQKIVEELEHGIVKNETKREFLDIIHRMIDKESIQGIILGCTELPMLIKKDDLNIHILNTTEIHVNKIVEQMITHV